MPTKKAKPKYPAELRWSAEDHTWIAEAYDLPGCMADGATQADALRELGKAVELWLTVAREEKRDIPEPSTETPASGKFVVRVPSSVHQRLRRRAQREGVSLNEMVVSMLSRSM